MKRVFLTGGLGYIGQALAQRLLEKGAHVSILDHMQNLQPPPKLPSSAILWQKEVSEMTPHMLQGVEILLHLAAHSSPRAKPSALKQDLADCQHLTEVATEAQVPFLLFFSSGAVYGATEAPVSEIAPALPQNPYARSKKEAEKIILSAASPHCTPWILRLGTLYGAAPRTRLDLPIHRMICSALENKRIVLARRGAIIRPFLALEDLLRAVEKILDQKPKASIWNLASENCSLLEIAHALSPLLPHSLLLTEEEGVSYALDSSHFCRQFHFHFAHSLARTLPLLVRELEALRET